jgi:hypothetical protein
VTRPKQDLAAKPDDSQAVTRGLAGSLETAPPSDESKKLLWDVLLSVLLVVVTISLEFIAHAITNPDDIAKFLANDGLLLDFLSKPFDLWLIGFSLIIAGSIGKENKKAEQWVFTTLILLLAFIFIALIFGTAAHRRWLTIGVPDCLGVISICICVISARRT